MLITVHLKDDGVEKLEGFKTRVRTSKDGQRWDEHFFFDLPVIRNKGRWRFILAELTDSIPDFVKDLVDEISFYDRIPRYPDRILGIYKYKDAEAELDCGGEASSYGLKIRGKSLENMLELYRKIRIGSICPEESYDGEHSGMSRAELEDDLWRTRHDLEQCNAELKKAQSLAWEKYTKLTALADTLMGDGWPFRFKQKVAEAIRKILKE